MADLAKIQNDLNSNPAEKEKFLADPVGYLEGNGVTLTAKDKQNLKGLVGGQPNLINDLVSVGVSVGT